MDARTIIESDARGRERRWIISRRKLTVGVVASVAIVAFVAAVDPADDLDDLRQETFLRVWRNRAKYNPDRGSVASWVAGIALNRARDASRRHAGKQRRCEQGVEPTVLESLLSVVPHVAIDASDAPEDILRLREALAELTERQRALLMARYAGDGDPPTSRELAKEFHSTPAAVRMDLSRAKAKIRAYFKAAKSVEPKKARRGGSVRLFLSVTPERIYQ